MNGFNITSLIAGLVTLAGSLSMVAGYPALGAVFSDPHTAQALTALVTAASGLWSMFTPALLHTTTTAAADKITIQKNGN
jgi:hypothetical protein